LSFVIGHWSLVIGHLNFRIGLRTPITHYALRTTHYVSLNYKVTPTQSQCEWVSFSFSEDTIMKILNAKPQSRKVAKGKIGHGHTDREFR